MQNRCFNQYLHSPHSPRIKTNLAYANGLFTKLLFGLKTVLWRTGSGKNAISSSFRTNTCLQALSRLTRRHTYFKAMSVANITTI